MSIGYLEPLVIYILRGRRLFRYGDLRASENDSKKSLVWIALFEITNESLENQNNIAQLE